MLAKILKIVITEYQDDTSSSDDMWTSAETIAQQTQQQKTNAVPITTNSLTVRKREFLF